LSKGFEVIPEINEDEIVEDIIEEEKKNGREFVDSDSEEEKEGQ